MFDKLVLYFGWSCLSGIITFAIGNIVFLKRSEDSRGGDEIITFYGQLNQQKAQIFSEKDWLSANLSAHLRTKEQQKLLKTKSKTIRLDSEELKFAAREPQAPNSFKKTRRGTRAGKNRLRKRFDFKPITEIKEPPEELDLLAIVKRLGQRSSEREDDELE